MAYTQDENIDFNSQLEEQNPYNIQTGDLEGLLDIISDKLIESPMVNTTTVKNNQKFIRGGSIKIGHGDGTLALYQKDVEANVEDDLQSIANQINGAFDVTINEGIDNTISISITGGGIEGGILDITNLVVGDGNPLNVSQFIPLQKQKSNVDIEKAEEFLDTNIFELLPAGDTRQSRIISFFEELNALLPPTIPNFGNPVDRVEGTDEWIDAEQYSQDNSISYAQDNPDESNIDEEQAFIHRLTDTANDANKPRTIQEIYNTILPYLTDLLEEAPTPQDDRPEYTNLSDGYLQFRNPNQGIIIRNANKDFIEGLDPDNPTWLTSDYNGLISATNQAILDNNNIADYNVANTFLLENPGTGFTITMWVRFLDKASSGTLFNFGNTTRSENPFGFKLETYVLNKDDTSRIITRQGNDINITYGKFVEEYNRKKELGLDVGPGYDNRIFNESDTARFVRLQVREYKKEGSNRYGDDGGLRDSHIGVAGDIRFDDGSEDWADGPYIGSGRKSINPGEVGGSGGDENRLLQSTYIPEDFNEWYFICATYNPEIKEDESIEKSRTNGTKDLSYTPDFWMNHLNAPDSNTRDVVVNSGFGNKCKVEIISRTDLLRARGFKV